MDLKKSRLVFLAVLLSVLLTSPAQSAVAPDISSIIGKIQNTYGDIRGFRAEFTQELTHQESGSTEKREGVLLFSKPLLVRWETFAPTPELLLVGEKEIWNYLPDEELAYKYSLELAQDSRSLIRVITGQIPLDQDYDVESMPASSEDGGLIHLLLYPKEPTPQITEAHLWVEPDSGLIRKAQVMDFYGNTNSISFNSLNRDETPKAEEFVFSPPKGTEVEDHTQADQPVRTPLLR